jgi:hypothetical protein
LTFSKWADAFFSFKRRRGDESLPIHAMKQITILLNTRDYQSTGLELLASPFEVLARRHDRENQYGTIARFLPSHHVKEQVSFLLSDMRGISLRDVRI